ARCGRQHAATFRRPLFHRHGGSTRRGHGESARGHPQSRPCSLAVGIRPCAFYSRLVQRCDAGAVAGRAISQSGPFVFVVKADNTVDLRPVKPGQRQDGDLTVIENGVKPGETVVVTGQLALSPGAKVAPQPYAAQTPGNSQQSAASKSSM